MYNFVLTCSGVKNIYHKSIECFRWCYGTNTTKNQRNTMIDRDTTDWQQLTNDFYLYMNVDSRHIDVQNKDWKYVKYVKFFKKSIKKAFNIKGTATKI